MPESELPGVLPAFLAGEPPKLVAAIEEGAPLFTYSRRDWLHHLRARRWFLDGTPCRGAKQIGGGADESGSLLLP